MGGCKCTYKECSKTSDGVTHFFHYPVKDVARCRVWMQNANRFNFEKLLTSQLKNRVICQDHFAKNMFMNYKCDRLVHKAIPTKDNADDENLLEVEFGNEEQYKTPLFPVDTNPASQSSKLEDVKPLRKEDSLMQINESPVLGLTFIPPHEKKRKNVPHVEYFTKYETLSQSYSKVTKQTNQCKENNEKDAEKSSHLLKNPLSVAKPRRVIFKSRIKNLNCNETKLKDSNNSLTINSSLEKQTDQSGFPTLISVNLNNTLTENILNSTHTIETDISSLPSDIVDTPNVPTFNIDVVSSADGTLNHVFHNNTSNLSKNNSSDKIFRSNFSVPPAKTIQPASYIQATAQIISGNKEVKSIVPELFKTPPKKVKSLLHVDNFVVNDAKSCAQKELFHEDNSISLNKGKINILTQKVLKKPMLLTNLQNSPTVNVINKQLLLYNKQKESRPHYNKEESISTSAVSTSKSDNIKQHMEDARINEYIKLIHENSKEIAELKRMLLAQQADKRGDLKLRFKSQKESRKYRRISKASLYARIVPFLSPKLAKMVHSEMFPSLAKYNKRM